MILKNKYNNKIYNSKEAADHHEDTLIKIFSVSDYSIHDGPGSRLVLFFQGCHIGCSWCHSPHSQYNISPILYYPQNCMMCKRCEKVCEHQVHQFDGEHHNLNRKNCIQCGKCIVACPQSSADNETSVLYLPTKTLTVNSLFAQIQPYLSLCDGVTLSGGEALLQTDACVKLLKLFKKHNINTAVETSGLLPISQYKRVIQYVDVWLFGVRVVVNNNQYSDLEKLIENATFLSSNSLTVIPRITVVPNIMNQKEVLKRIQTVLLAMNQKNVWLNPWNVSYSTYYQACGLQLSFPEPANKEIVNTQSDIIQFLLEKQFNIINYNDLARNESE